MLRNLTLIASLLVAILTPTEEATAVAASSVASDLSSSSQVVGSSAATGHVVTLANTEVFVVQTSPIASLSPSARAALIQQNIQNFADSGRDVKQLLITTKSEGEVIGDGESALLVITNQDAQLAGKPTIELAQEVLQKLQTALPIYRTKHTWQVYGVSGVYTLLSILGLWQALYWNKRAFVWLANRMRLIRTHWKNGIRVKEVEVVSVHRIEKLAMLALRALRIFVVLLCLYFFLPLILSFFPETRQLGGTIFGYFLTPFKTIFFTVIKYIPNLFYIFVIGVIASYVLKLFAYLFNLIEQGVLKFDWFYNDWARPTYQIVRFLVIITALISAYPYIPGSSSEAFQGVGLVLGAIISFASSSAISNIVAGIILTYTRAFRLNDRIKVGDTIGDVVEKTLLVTRVKTIKHVVVTIPNSLVMGAQIVNYSTSATEGAGVILHTSVTIGYDVPWLQVEALLVAAALDTKQLLKQPQPFVLQTSLDDWYVAYEINAYTQKPEHMAEIYSDLHRNIQEKFNAAEVEIMSPHYMTLRDGNASTVPSVLSGVGYKSPSFQINVHDKCHP
ncbi:MAG: mechanosensitive ion channel protein [Gallionellales bacterium CG_4_10_14_3_um_filter_54_96]|nr:MAG: mechanosensitive ion channel protein [Gallionellales bacterium CG03_land_8_20_14_0_80_55_15]PIV91582.1 MAG: mechanosensitive ion channel protein [Gallionellales bacterium CG17_big_fil_post_rev_8_21_14_2_50_54_146]PIX04855.1 MAG: mechanosensitive ion channel protein [Gallionellales bacterium CG_4_8_14_3_um_filter_54_18]PIY05639.1 MAG: mechanosensitive ion channel protein [Gallionellales bacterium CG_4_10_14_3_um_filter_54_96]PJC03966.1 MAG: mechanosensitive ion channel protein [Gallionel